MAVPPKRVGVEDQMRAQAGIGHQLAAGAEAGLRGNVRTQAQAEHVAPLCARAEVCRSSQEVVAQSNCESSGRERVALQAEVGALAARELDVKSQPRPQPSGERRREPAELGARPLNRGIGAAFADAINRTAAETVADSLREPQQYRWTTNRR